MTLGIIIKCQCAECRYAEWHVLFIFMLSVVMLSVVMLSVVMLSVVMRSDVASVAQLWYTRHLEPDKRLGQNWLVRTNTAETFTAGKRFKTDA
jgi:hypothetical protein